jgi:hypothetical protein
MRSDFSLIGDRAARLAKRYQTAMHRDYPLMHALLSERIARLSETAAIPVPLSTQALWRHLGLDTAENCRALPDSAARFLVLELMAECPFRHSPLRLPSSVRALYPPQLERILQAVEADDAELDLFTDPWRKNLRILTGSLVPVGAELADPFAGIPRSTLLRGGARQSVNFAATIAFRTRGFRPCLELHTHPDSLEEFNIDGWVATYHRLAELLEANPQYRAVIASSWFRDPALATISPRLNYLREYPCEHGARLFMTERDRLGTSGALTRSPTRRRMFKEGTYIPTIHLMVWSR